MGAAVILATTDAHEIVLVEQLRRALGKPTIELPAGLIGDDGDFDASAAAARELAEETGFVATEWTCLGEFATSPGMSAEMFTLFRARGLTRTGPRRRGRRRGHHGPCRAARRPHGVARVGAGAGVRDRLPAGRGAGARLISLSYTVDPRYAGAVIWTALSRRFARLVPTHTGEEKEFRASA